MDLDAYVRAKSPTWQRLDELSRKRHLTGAESDEILDAYQRTATHLSVIRSSAPDRAVVAYLSTLLARARGHALGSTVTTWDQLVRYVTITLPAALYSTRRWWLTVMVVSIAFAVGIGWWLLDHPTMEHTFGSREQIEHLVNDDFENYYSENAASSFAFEVWTNNFRLALLCIAFGVFGFPVIWMLYQNILNLAVTGSIMINHGRADLFFGLITPHGLLELTCLFVAAGVGLRIFWSWVAPGDRKRSDSLAEAGRTAIAIGIGLVVLLLICGAIEAFVTPSGLPTWARIGIGVTVWVGFLLYALVLGRRAHDRGATGDLDEIDRGYPSPDRCPGRQAAQSIPRDFSSR